MVNLIASMVKMGLYGDSMEVILLWRFYGKISLEIVWGCHGGKMVNQITRQSPYHFYHKSSMKSTTLHTVSILSNGGFRGPLTYTTRNNRDHTHISKFFS